MTKFKSILDTQNITMTSLEIAELTSKSLGHIHRDIKKMLSDLDHPKVDHELDQRGYASKYTLNYELTITLISGYETKIRNLIIKRWLELEQQQHAWQDARTLTKRSYVTMSDALTEHRKSLGKETQAFHYSNEATLINKIMGLGSKNNRDGLDQETLSLIDTMTGLNTQLIRVGMAFKDRKKMVGDLYGKAIVNRNALS